MLTATPINNRLIDLQHLIEHFTGRQADYFKDTLGIHSLPGHFRKLEKELMKRLGTDVVQGELVGLETTDLLSHDPLLRELVIQRSRAYVKQSQITAGAREALFPKREAPKVADYSIKKTYGKLLAMVEKAFNKKTPLFTLPMYYPLAYSKVPVEDGFEDNRQKQVVGLIRVLFLKRFESSARAFESSCQQLLLKLMAFVQVNSTTKHEATSPVVQFIVRSVDEILKTEFGIDDGLASTITWRCDSCRKRSARLNPWLRPINSARMQLGRMEGFSSRSP